MQENYQQWATHYFKWKYSWQRLWCLTRLEPIQRHTLWDMEKKLGYTIPEGNICQMFHITQMQMDNYPIQHWKQKLLSIIDTVMFNQEVEDAENMQKIDYAVLNAGILS